MQNLEAGKRVSFKLGAEARRGHRTLNSWGGHFDHVMVSILIYDRYVQEEPFSSEAHISHLLHPSSNSLQSAPVNRLCSMSNSPEKNPNRTKWKHHSPTSYKHSLTLELSHSSPRETPRQLSPVFFHPAQLVWVTTSVCLKVVKIHFTMLITNNGHELGKCGSVHGSWCAWFMNHGPSWTFRCQINWFGSWPSRTALTNVRH